MGNEDLATGSEWGQKKFNIETRLKERELPLAAERLKT